MTAALIGIGIAAAVAMFAWLAGLDRDRAFYPTVLIVVGSYYLLFASMGGGGNEFAQELVPFVLFAAAAAIGFRKSLWIVVGGLAGHGLFDFTRQFVLAGRGVPAWWPAFCAGFDVAAAAVLAAILLRRGNALRR